MPTLLESHGGKKAKETTLLGASAYVWLPHPLFLSVIVT